ncbi:MAG TPA: sigma factor-like helix-turn-helix DNA-binding protein, partial [Nitrolancea sp.]|nr:sigma factor-like helix-turn-helix DNA-binding protein [Nitrolancea sp.]
RVCLDMLRSRKSRHEESLDAQLSERIANRQDENDPEHEALLTDSVGLALLVVLEALAPAERVAFVLHDLFAVPFDEIAPILGRSSTAARQLASRGRRRVHGADTVSDADFFDQHQVVSAFLNATRFGDFDALLAVLDPDVVRRADAVVVPAGGSTIERGAANVAAGAIVAARRAPDSRLAWVNGGLGFVWAPDGEPRIVLSFTIARGKITAIDVIADPARLSQLVPTYLDR